jgi:hypothetical protein
MDCEVIEEIGNKLYDIPWVRSQGEFTEVAYAKLQKYCKEVSTTFEDEDIYVSCRTYDNRVLTFVVTIKLRPRFTKRLGKIYDVLRDFDGYEMVNAVDVKNLNEVMNTVLQPKYRVGFKIYEDAEDLGIVVARFQDAPIGGYFVFRNIMFTSELSIYDLNKGTERTVTIPIEFAVDNVIYECEDNE